ncbi:MAG: DNA mismatch repair endonuclease MutL [Pyrinomonadaceae bacterium]
MNKVKILPDKLANQIAAGEVVERPASVIKELIENSIDAGAERISVEIELGGRRLMRVTDDGAGMSRDDAILAFERHATSKISTLEDLGKIATLGFRGEALASIASVAKVEMITKTAEEAAGTRVYFEGGKLVDVRETGRSVGTTLTVRELFFNTPARRKFMRSEATENYHITATVTHYALANPEIAFVLTNNGRENLRVPPAANLRERAYQIFGGDLLESLLPLEGGTEYVARITGYISAPRERRTTRDAQYFFINGRYVKDKVIAGGLLEGYRSVLPHGVYPVAFLLLEVPLEEIDVNVHPAKTEVRFRRAQAVKEVIAQAVREALQRAGVVEQKKFEFGEPEQKDLSFSETPADRKIEQGRMEFPVETPPQSRIGVQESETTGEKEAGKEFEIPITSGDFEEAARMRGGENELETQGATGGDEVSSPISGPVTVEKNEPVSKETEEPSFPSTEEKGRYAVLPPVDSAEKIPRSIEVSEVSSSKIRPIGQLHNSFIIAVDDEGMLLIDQHVAHERILFDKFRKREKERKIESQNLLLPETIDLTPAQSAAFELVAEELEDCGFGLMHLSGRTVAVKSVPTDLPTSEIRNLLAEILDTAESERRGNAHASIRDHIAASLACKAAVKINMHLTNEKMQWLIDRLLITSSPTTCPHGRPVILRLTMKDIERKFHRT